MSTSESTTERVIRATPGPWKVWIAPSDASVNIVNDRGEYVALVGRDAQPATSSATVTPEQIEDEHDRLRADARLIAAAPLLLQALREVIGAHEEAGNCFYCEVNAGQPHEPDCTMHFVWDAIAKAEGRS